MEYSKGETDDWSVINDTEVTGLEKGSYDVRFKESGEVLASKAVTVNVPGHGEAAYTVKHMWQNAENDVYTEHERETLTGVVGQNTEAEAKTYTGFKAQEPVTQEKVTVDGKTVVEIKYDRKSYTLTWNLDGGKIDESVPYTKAGSVRFGKRIVAPKVTKDNEFFVGWDPEVAATMPADNTGYAAKWTKVAPPAIDPNGGTFKGSRQITITCPTADAEIWYTTDGSSPVDSTTRMQYTGPITIKKTTVLKAVAVVPATPAAAEERSVVAEAEFTRKGGYSGGGGSGTIYTPVVIADVVPKTGDRPVFWWLAELFGW